MADSHGVLLLAVSLLLLANHVALVVSEKRVAHLPGYEGPLPFELFTGYITVNETTGDNLFYYFIKSERNPAEDPLILWVTGGPGCTSFSGLALEIGPIRFKVEKYNGSVPGLVFNPYAFTKIASIIFIDSPVGTGFSYTLTEESSQTGDFKTIEEAYTFLTKWLLNHPEFCSNPLYIGGDSYGGKIVTLLTLRIVKGIEEGSKLLSNLKGYLEGNPYTQPQLTAWRIRFANRMGLIPDDLYEATESSCHGQYEVPNSEECAKNIRAAEAMYADINLKHVDEVFCGRIWYPKLPESMMFLRRTLGENQADFSITPVPPIECEDYTYFLSVMWANSESVRKALHIRKGTVMEWIRCNLTIKATYIKEVGSVVKHHQYLTSKGYHVLVYSGDHDLLVPHIETEEWINSLNYSILEEWHPWFVGHQVAGYTRKYAPNLTYATVKGGGHEAPSGKPKECYQLFKRWISGQPL